MTLESLVPVADPVPLPAPYWLLKTLLLVTFTLHILAMNCMLGSAIIAAVARFRRRSVDNARLAVDLGKRIPTFLAATVTIGIAPLLFVQVLYGQFFYTSTVLIAWPWLTVVALVTFALLRFLLDRPFPVRFERPADCHGGCERACGPVRCLYLHEQFHPDVVAGEMEGHLPG